MFNKVKNFALIASLLTGAVQAKEKLNVVVIMADDLGYGDLSCYGATTFKTPNIDKLAANGLKFTSGYCSSSTCTPTRYSFLTGQYAWRRKGTGVAPPNGPAIIKPGTPTLPSALQRAGYKTAVIGKWHLGLGKKAPDWNGDLKPGPLEIGFDYNFLLPTTNDRVPQVYVENHRVLNLDPKDPLWVGRKKPSEDHPTGVSHRDTLKMDWSHGHNNTIHNGIGRIGFYTGGHAARFRDEDLTDKWVEKTNEWIEANKDEPFFLFHASHSIHVPRMPHERFQGKTPHGFRGDAIVEMDWSVGEIMKTLDRLGLSEKTLIIFCSDNGPVLDDGYKDGAKTMLGEHKPSGPYSGGKYSVNEGGTRTPFIAYLPKTIKPGVSDEMICTIDLPATLAKLANEPLQEGEFPDSFTLDDVLMGNEGAKGRDHLIQADNWGSKLGLRQGDWKLMYLNPYNRKTKKSTLSYRLYNLKDDPKEKKDLSKKNPEKLAEMKAFLETVKKNPQSRR